MLRKKSKGNRRGLSDLIRRSHLGARSGASPGARVVEGGFCFVSRYDGSPSRPHALLPHLSTFRAVPVRSLSERPSARSGAGGYGVARPPHRNTAT